MEAIAGPVIVDAALESMERRARYAERVRKSLRKIEIERQLCKDDPVHWFRQWVYGYDPRLADPYVPFDPWPKQAAFVEWMLEREETRTSGLAEKCRDAGVTMMGCGYGVHGFIFREGFRMGFGSQKEEYVDRIGDPKSIFEKIRFILRNLPEWMMPRGWEAKRHDNFRRIVNPQNGASLSGEAGDDIGRGDRTAIYWLDEAAVVERADSAEAALSQTSNVRIYVSTPRGPGNWFYRKRFGGNLAVFTMQWTDDPRKDAEWLEKQKKELPAHIVAQEILLDYTASIEGVFIPAAWVRAAVGLDLPETGPVIAGLDIGEEGDDSSVLTPRRGPKIGAIVSWGHCNTNQTAYRVIDECKALGVSVLHFDSVGVGVGPKGIWQDMQLDDERTQQTQLTRKLPFITVPIQGGTPASGRIWPDGRSSAETFQDLNGELWWCLRQRFERTFEFVTQGVAHPAEDMISIPDHAELVAQLSMPLLIRNDRGKIGRESKKAMRTRGVKSPDFAESLAYSFNPFGDFEIKGSDVNESVGRQMMQAGEVDRRLVDGTDSGLGAYIMDMHF